MEPGLPKLSWFPIYVEKILSSLSWQQMTDYQRGWYIQLLLSSAHSERPGYLPNDGSLWRLAGARSKHFFNQDSAVVMARFKSTQMDGRLWIYNPKLLEVLEEQADKHESANRKKGGKVKGKMLKKEENLSLSFVSPESLKQTIKDLFDFYMEHFDRDESYKLTESREQDCASRLDELLQSNHGDLGAARESAQEAILNLSHSQFHVEHGYIDWSDHIFKSTEIFQKRMAMAAPAAKQSGNCDKHPDSGLTSWGACGGCYFATTETTETVA